MNSPFAVGDRVEIALPDPDGPDAKYDGRTGEVVAVNRDSLGELVDDPLASFMYTVQLDDGDTFPARYHDIVALED